MRLIETRLLDGPNVYRLVPVIKVEVAIGRRRSWYGQREPERHALVKLAAPVPRSGQPPRIAGLADWVRRLRRSHPDGAIGGVTVHRSSDPGHWIVVWPWSMDDRAKAIADAALTLTGRDIRPGLSTRVTPRQARLIEGLESRVEAAEGDGPAWVRDSQRRLPVVAITGTNGKTTTTRLVAHLLRAAGRRVGATTSDGIVVGAEMVEPGDWTGPGGAKAILDRSDVDVAVLETARGGILLRGVGYESNEASVVTNISSDHMDLQGIHTLPELVEVKSVVPRMTRANGWVVLNADDRYVSQIARQVRGKVAFFTLDGDRSARVRRHLRAGGRAYLVRGDRMGEAEGSTWRPIEVLAGVPIALGGIARHNVANALAAAGAARAMGATIAQVRAGLKSFRPTTDDSRGRLNVFRDATRVVIVDFAHNEAGVAMLLDVAEAIAKGVGGAPVTGIVGLAGDRPDDTLRGVGKIVAQRVDRFVEKEMRHYLRGRTRESVLGEIRQGAREGGWKGEIPVYGSEVEAVSAELDRTDPAATGEPADGVTDVIFLLCHEQREEVYELLAERHLRPIDDPHELAALVSSR